MKVRFGVAMAQGVISALVVDGFDDSAGTNTQPSVNQWGFYCEAHLHGEPGIRKLWWIDDDRSGRVRGNRLAIILKGVDCPLSGWREVVFPICSVSGGCDK